MFPVRRREADRNFEIRCRILQIRGRQFLETLNILLGLHRCRIRCLRRFERQGKFQATNAAYRLFWTCL
jgi:hypothetical protein